MSTFTSDDFAAFLVYAGPPALVFDGSRPSNIDGKINSPELYLKKRYEYADMADKFCRGYFPPPAMLRKGEETDLWVEFYRQFVEWFAIRKEMEADAVGQINYRQCSSLSASALRKHRGN